MACRLDTFSTVNNNTGFKTKSSPFKAKTKTETSLPYIVFTYHLQWVSSLTFHSTYNVGHFVEEYFPQITWLWYWQKCHTGTFTHRIYVHSVVNIPSVKNIRNARTAKSHPRELCGWKCPQWWLRCSSSAVVRGSPGVMALYHCILNKITVIPLLLEGNYSYTTATQKVKRNIAHKVLPLPHCKF